MTQLDNYEVERQSIMVSGAWRLGGIGNKWKMDVLE